jgi:PhzF family phenazine biosynthesis protein
MGVIVRQAGPDLAGERRLGNVAPVRAFVIDAFADEAFRGNPAGVVLLDRPVDAAWMQDVAAELKHSETAFVTSRPGGEYDLRWFTPAVEVDLCGHATMATTHALRAAGASGPFAFHTRSGVLRTSIDDDGTISMDFPAQPATPMDEPDGLADALGAEVLGVHGNGIDVLVELADASAVAKLTPDIGRLRAVPGRGVVVTAEGDGHDTDFVSRFFAPRVGVDEDPVTGSAHCMLTPFWATRLGRASLTAHQLSPRGGRLEVTLDGERVVLRGRAVIVLDGTLLV